MVPASLGTQTAGSIIRPASFCGVLGYKPSFGELPTAGIRPLAPSLDTLGIFARSVSDLPLLSQAIRGKQRPLPILRGPPRIGLCRTEQWPLADPDSQRVVLDSVDRLRKAGAQVEELELGDSFHRLLEAQKRVMAVEASQALKNERQRHADALGRKLHELFADADACSPEAYRSALKQAEECRRQMLPIFSRHEVLISPSATGEAPAGLEATGDPVFNRIWTMLHLPCISLPVGTGRTGLPIGLQAVGEAGGDVRLLVFADWIHSRLLGAV
jgi:Asp-tRNA(Asn)/Glu-tRNA(Gln) amidotransferase A subunit family amidase